MSKASTGITCLQLKAPIALKYRKEKCSSEYRKDPLYRVRKPGSLKSLLTHTRRKSYLGKIPGPISSYGPRNYSLSWFSLLCSCFLWRSSVSLCVCCQTDSLLSGVLALRQQCQQKEEGLRGCDLGLHSETDKKKKKTATVIYQKRLFFLIQKQRFQVKLITAKWKYTRPYVPQKLSLKDTMRLC